MGACMGSRGGAAVWRGGLQWGGRLRWGEGLQCWGGMQWGGLQWGRGLQCVAGLQWGGAAVYVWGGCSVGGLQCPRAPPQSQQCAAALRAPGPAHPTAPTAPSPRTASPAPSPTSMQRCVHACAPGGGRLACAWRVHPCVDPCVCSEHVLLVHGCSWRSFTQFARVGSVHACAQGACVQLACGVLSAHMISACACT